jgi:hypothetical protein
MVEVGRVRVRVVVAVVVELARVARRAVRSLMIWGGFDDTGEWGGGGVRGEGLRVEAG